MSAPKVKRYYGDDYYDSENGTFVLYTDYEQAIRERDEHARKVAELAFDLWSAPGHTFEECIDAALRELSGDK
jgi:hypothetical protein